MQKKLFFTLFILIISGITEFINSQDFVKDQFKLNQTAINDSCAGGEIHDGNTLESSTGLVNVSEEFVIRMRPNSYPWAYTNVCWAMNTNPGGGPACTVDVVVYDTTGTSGSPGLIVYQQNGINLSGIPNSPSYKWFSTTVTPPTLYSGSYWVGIRLNTTAFPNRLLSFHQVSNTTAYPTYFRANSTSWGPLTNTTGGLNYVCFGIRTLGFQPPVFCRTGLNLAIPDNVPAGVNDSIVISGISGNSVTNVYVTIDSLNHTWVGDLVIKLIKGSTTVYILSRPGPGTAFGSSGQNFKSTSFADTARYSIDSIGTTGSPIPQFNQPFTGWFRCNQNPVGNPIPVMDSLSRFRGTNPNGTWVLNTADLAAAFTGTLISWCITIQYTNVLGGISEISVPNRYLLEQNYPNPFNPSTKIRYGIPKPGNVKIVIYDLLGRQVMTPVNEFKHEGIYDVSIDASALSSGAYFYRIESGNFIETKKMLLIK